MCACGERTRGRIVVGIVAVVTASCARTRANHFLHVRGRGRVDEVDDGDRLGG